MNEVHKLIDRLIQETRIIHPDRPALIGVGGAQGSGKTFQCDSFARNSPLRIAHFSLDDVYLTQRARTNLGHPMFVARGAPGTHDLNAAHEVLNLLWKGYSADLPRYNKRADAPANDRPFFRAPAHAVLVDGWCMGATPPPQTAPINALEREEDADGVWRKAVRGYLAESYRDFFARFDQIIYLQAPGFHVVPHWRGQQEEAMLGQPMSLEQCAALDRFIQHYERLTRHMLAGGHTARWIVRLDEARNVVSVERAN